MTQEKLLSLSLQADQALEKFDYDTFIQTNQALIQLSLEEPRAMDKVVSLDEFIRQNAEDFCKAGNLTIEEFCQNVNDGNEEDWEQSSSACDLWRFAALGNNVGACLKLADYLLDYKLNGIGSDYKLAFVYANQAVQQAGTFDEKYAALKARGMMYFCCNAHDYDGSFPQSPDFVKAVEDFKALADLCRKNGNADEGHWWIMAGRAAHAADGKWVTGNPSFYFRQAVTVGNADGWAYLGWEMYLTGLRPLTNELGDALYARMNSVREKYTADDFLDIGILEGSALALYFKVLKTYEQKLQKNFSLDGSIQDSIQNSILYDKLIYLCYDLTEWVQMAVEKCDRIIPETCGLLARIKAVTDCQDAFTNVGEDYCDPSAYAGHLLLVKDSSGDFYINDPMEVFNLFSQALDYVRSDGDPTSMYAIALREEEPEMRLHYLEAAYAYGSREALEYLKSNNLW